MEDIELKRKLQEKSDELLKLCSEESKAKELLDDIISLKGQIETKPARIFIPEDSVEDEIKGSHYYVAKTKKESIFHLYGGYTLIVGKPLLETPLFPGDGTEQAIRGFRSLYETLNYFFDKLDDDDLTKEDLEAKGTMLTAVQYILELPTFAFTDTEFTLDMAVRCVQFLQSTYEKYSEIAKEKAKEEGDFDEGAFREMVSGLSEDSENP